MIFLIINANEPRTGLICRNLLQIQVPFMGNYTEHVYRGKSINGEKAKQKRRRNGGEAKGLGCFYISLMVGVLLFSMEHPADIKIQTNCPVIA
jgi:hypothetical protein